MSRFLSPLLPTAQSDPELHRVRPALEFAFLTALTWQIAVGTPMVLFAQRLGASPFQVGLAYAALYLMTPVQVLATALLPRYGFKRLTLGGWRARSFFLLVPLVIAGARPAQGNDWLVVALVGSVFFFCFFRCIGVAALPAWIYALIPSSVRGRYFASEQLNSGVAGALTLVLSAALFALLPFYPALLAQYLIALIGSTLSYYALKRLPDAPTPASVGVRRILIDTPRHLFASGGFRRYLWMSAGWMTLTTPIPPFAAYYLKLAPQLPAGAIMTLEVLRYLAMGVGAWFIRRWIDARGIKVFFQAALLGLALVLIYWLAYLRFGFGGYAGLCAVYLLFGIASVCWLVASANYLPRVIPDGERALMVALYGAATFVLGGLSPVLWGPLLKNQAGFSVGAFFAFFLTELLATAVLAVLMMRRLDWRDPAVLPTP